MSKVKKGWRGDLTFGSQSSAMWLYTNGRTALIHTHKSDKCGKSGMWHFDRGWR